MYFSSEAFTSLAMTLLTGGWVTMLTRTMEKFWASDLLSIFSLRPLGIYGGVSYWTYCHSMSTDLLMSTWSRLLGDVMVRAWVLLVRLSPREEEYGEDVPAAVAARVTIEVKKRIVIEVLSV